MLREAWSSEIIAYGDGREYDASKLQGIVAETGDERAGLATYAIAAGDCEIVTLNAFTIGGGVGGALVEAVVDAARAAGCARVCVTTTNDNLPALRVYQRHGFALTALHRGAVEIARRRKPQIARVGHAGIPIRDELVLVRSL
jgi:GNAT superfamily N-acetyltransferase